MNENFYKHLIENSPTGYAYHKIICDKDGIPCDFEFIEVNVAFEKLTGLKGSDIVGRRITKVLPNLKENELKLIHIYGDIAVNGGEKELERFSEALKCWYKVSIYSSEKYYFTTLFTDITKQMTQLPEMERLLQISEEFLQMNEQELNYQKITDDFLKISRAKYAAFNLYNKGGKSFTTIAISADNEILKKASNIMGSKIVGRQWEYDPVRTEKIKSGTITRFHSLRELVGNVMPTALVALLEKIFNIGEVILIKIRKSNIMIGDFTLFMNKGETFNKDTLCEIYARQLGLLIIRKWAQDELLIEKKLIDAIFNSVPGLIYLYDNQGKLVRWNKKHEEIIGYSPEELSQMTYFDWFKGDEESFKVFMEGMTRAGEYGFADGEAKLQKKDGTIVPMYFTGSALYLDGKQYFVGLGLDITERKKKEEEIYYLSYHDQLTGLYNRRFYEEELKRLDTERNLPVSIVMGDVNGLKLINDSFGHVIGDDLLKKVAEVITQGCRDDDIIARLGGDEFVIILPKTDALVAEQIIKRISDLSLSEKLGSVDISISFGYGTKNDKKESIEDILKNAEDHMYKKKLLEGQTMRTKIIKDILNAFHDKNKWEEQHSHRVSELCKRMGEALELPENDIKELVSAGLIHDIGKTAIDENILNKPGKLTDDEWKEIKRHPEIGYRMLNTANDMSDMAIYVLYHHERWDGTGYPKGLKGDEIPIKSRIIAITGAYDTMTSESIHRSALPKEVGIEELQKYAGIQFDPELVSVFIEGIELN